MKYFQESTNFFYFWPREPEPTLLHVSTLYKGGTGEENGGGDGSSDWGDGDSSVGDGGGGLGARQRRRWSCWQPVDLGSAALADGAQQVKVPLLEVLDDCL